MSHDLHPHATGTPSLTLLWRLAALPAAILVVVVAGSMVALVFGVEISDDRLSALWVLTAALLGTLGAFAAALLTAGGQQESTARAADEADRAAAERERESRRAGAEKAQESERLGLQATIEGVRLLQSGASPVTRAVVAGALANVVKLGNATVAMRMLGPLAESGQVDPGTAAWVIDQVLGQQSGPAQVGPRPVGEGPPAVDESVNDVAYFLLQHHTTFLSTGMDGMFVWPGSCAEYWDPRLVGNPGGLTLYALASLLVSRSQAWWRADGASWTWVWEAMSKAHNVGVRANDDLVPSIARAFLRELVDADELGLGENDPWRAAIAHTDDDAHWDEQLAGRIDQLRRWMADAQSAPEPGPTDHVIFRTLAPSPAPTVT